MVILKSILILLHFYVEHIDSQSTESLGKQRVCCFKDRVVRQCFTACTENTCANLLYPPIQGCSKVCIPNICVCRDGLYRNECNECVTKEECSKTCKQSQRIKCPGKFERLYGCFDPTQARVCPTARCSKPRDFLLKYAKRSNQSGLCALNTCDCIDGYLRNKCGQCVPANECNRPCCVGKCSKCSGPNEVRVKKFRKCKARTCKNLKFPTKCTGRAARVRKNVCDCKIGYRRNKCGKCVPENECNDDVPCVCTNPCGNDGREWQCLNDCNGPTCKNYHELKTKTCPSECTYVCACRKLDNFWYNGTACVPGDQCPPYDIAKNFPYVPVSSIVQPVPLDLLNPPSEEPQTTRSTPTESTQTESTQSESTETEPAIISVGISIEPISPETTTMISTEAISTTTQASQNPAGPILSIGDIITIGKK